MCARVPRGLGNAVQTRGSVQPPRIEGAGAAASTSETAGRPKTLTVTEIMAVVCEVAERTMIGEATPPFLFASVSPLSFPDDWLVPKLK